MGVDMEFGLCVILTVILQRWGTPPTPLNGRSLPKAGGRVWRKPLEILGFTSPVDSIGG